LNRLNDETARCKSRKLDQTSPEETLNQKILDTLSGKETKEEDDSARIEENSNPAENDDDDIEKLLQEVGTVQIGSTHWKAIFTAIF